MSDNLIMDMFCFWKLPGKFWKLVWNDLTTEFRVQKMIPSKTQDLFEKQAPRSAKAGHPSTMELLVGGLNPSEKY